MKTIRVTDQEWAKAGVGYVRTEAMVLGFGVSLQGEFGGDTPESEYILVTDDQGVPLSTCRLYFEPDKGYAKIERVATVSGARGMGAGRAGIEAAEEWILERGFKKIIITSRDEAVGFYEKLGYHADETVDPHAFDHPTADLKTKGESSLKEDHPSTSDKEKEVHSKPKSTGLFRTVYMEKEF